jgi:hypothetical protein
MENALGRWKDDDSPPYRPYIWMVSSEWVELADMQQNAVALPLLKSAKPSFWQRFAQGFAQAVAMTRRR